MRRSLSLSLHLMRASRRAMAAPATDRPRPAGELIWLHAASGTHPGALAHLAERLLAARPGGTVLVTQAGGGTAGPAGLPGGCIAASAPAADLRGAEAQLDHWRPGVVAVIGDDLPAALIVAAAARGVPLVMADARLAQIARHWAFVRRGMTAALLSRFRRILAQDAGAVRRIRAAAGAGVAVTLAGRIEETTTPPECDPAEHTAMVELMEARPVWLAMGCRQGEEEAVIAAHARALRMAHRMLLVAVPADPGRGAALAERMRAQGWQVSRAALREEPEADIQVHVADGDEAPGLWYRIAPITFMGGTLVEDAATRNPFEPAALGSAIIHGPFTAPYPKAFEKLQQMGATYPLDGPADLPEAVSQLIAPDRAAQLAHNAWAASTGGAEVADRVVAAIVAELDGLPAGAAAR